MPGGASREVDRVQGGQYGRRAAVPGDLRVIRHASCPRCRNLTALLPLPAVRPDDFSAVRPDDTAATVCYGRT
ncbi:hypothetical protein C4B68_15350 [Streptomyces dengpaensis]|uniref:Uncharacterized protein n=1 Tax=Streptomyces dengpaensis TaxID=2049881 RepID=A0ABN5I0S7_9ACTN|nr:hypothetical protein C4B68_15350 [Streptomyces dengpaensis]PIB09171.1 hypothetical protein B1C81_13170 [Streptomyces sp. HG99]